MWCGWWKSPVDKVIQALAPLSHLSQRSRVMLATVGGIVAGVLLVATGWAPAQLIGAFLIGAALVLARGGTRLAEGWFSDPRAQVVTVRRRVRQVTPVWAWQATIGALLVLALVVMTVSLLTHGAVSLGTLGDFGKGAIALVMMASLAFWNLNGVAWRFNRRPTETQPVEDVL
jgi:hypothetical protein